MRKRTIIAISILLVGVGGAAWLVFGNTTNAGALNISITGAGTDDARFTNSANQLAINDNSNSTDDAARAYGLEILKLNPQGMGADKQIALPSDAVLNDIVKKATDKPIQVSYFTEKDIKILNTSSESAVKTYLKTIAAADKKNNGLTSEFYSIISSYVIGSDSQRLIDLNNNISVYITTLLSTPAPSSWAGFHLALLNLWQAKLAYSQVFINKDDDPLRAATASKSLSTLLSQENNVRLDFENHVRGIKF